MIDTLGDVPPLSIMSQSIAMGRNQNCGQQPQLNQCHNQMMNDSSPHIFNPNQPQQQPGAPANMHHMSSNMPSQKGSMTMDSQYMQQQSQIFVFSTQLANQAAEAVDLGQFQSIIDFHCARLGTRKLPSQNPAVWLNNLAQMKQGGRGIKGNMMNPGGGIPSPMMNNSFGGMPRGGMMTCDGPCNAHNSACFPGPGPGPPPGPGPGPGWPPNQNMYCNPSQQQQQQQQPFAQDIDSFSQSNKFPIAEENLTPQQRQHRQNKLALLRNIQQQLCPEMIQQDQPSGQPRLPEHSSPGPNTPSDNNNSNNGISKNNSPKSFQSSLATSTSSLINVSNNNCSVPRTTMCTNATSNAANINPSKPIPPSSSPSNANNKKMLGSQTPKTLSPDCNDLLTPNVSSGNSLDSNRNKGFPNDNSMLGSNSCSSPFICKSEPTLMPVPSPQQIQYCVSAFEGQELTIQKQPNTSLRETDLISPSDFDLGIQNDFVGNCPPQINERVPNFIDNMNHRFPANSPLGNMMGPQFDMNPMNQRFMNPENQRFMNPDNQRFGPGPGSGPGPMFDGPPHPRMQGDRFGGPNMSCMPPYGGGGGGGGPQMDNSMMRFNNPCDGMPPRIRGPNPMEMGVRFPSHINDNIQSPSQFGSPSLPPMNNDSIMQFPGSNQAQGPNCNLGPVNNFNSGVIDAGVSSTHLQNLQKMTPPFDIGPPNKLDGMIVPNGSIPHSTANTVLHGTNGPINNQVTQSQRSTHFDPIASMAAMGDPQTTPNQNLMSSTMNMSNMQVTTNGPQQGNMVNFHSNMSSMQGMQQMGPQTMGPDGMPGVNGGNMQTHFNNMSQQNIINMPGPPQTVNINNTYVNARMSIEQMNIQNVNSPNYNPNMDPPMNNPNMPPHNIQNPTMSPPSNMQMMPHGVGGPNKMGQNFGGNRPMGPGGPGNGGPFSNAQMTNQRGMNPMNYPSGNPSMMPRGMYNSANIQVKPDAPNTIQYLPARPQNSNSVPNRPPSFDFLTRFAPPLTNLDNKLPTHNLQYFPNNGNNMNNPQPMSMPNRMGSQNIPMASGPGRPMSGPMIRNSNANLGPPPGMMGPGSGDMYGRPPAPNNLPNIPQPNSQPPNMFPNMKSGGPSGPMSPGGGIPPDATQPLPPSVGPSYNYKQSQFYNPVSSDPNYALQFQNFQQQLYACNRNPNNNSGSTGANNSRVNSSGMPTGNFYGPPK